MKRTQSRKLPAMAPAAFRVTFTVEPEPLLVLEVLATAVGDVGLGDEHEVAATKNADATADMLGNEEPVTTTS